MHDPDRYSLTRVRISNSRRSFLKLTKTDCDTGLQ